MEGPARGASVKKYPSIRPVDPNIVQLELHDRVGFADWSLYKFPNLVEFDSYEGLCRYLANDLKLSEEVADRLLTMTVNYRLINLDLRDKSTHVVIRSHYEDGDLI